MLHLIQNRACERTVGNSDVEARATKAQLMGCLSYDAERAEYAIHVLTTRTQRTANGYNTCATRGTYDSQDLNNYLFNCARIFRGMHCHELRS